jgi:hypothetical protein
MSGFTVRELSDVHRGWAFSCYPAGVRHFLRKARLRAIVLLAQDALKSRVGAVVMAGDTFYAQTPASDTSRHAMTVTTKDSGIIWFLLWGSHDSSAAAEVWQDFWQESFLWRSTVKSETVRKPQSTLPEYACNFESSLSL